MIEKPRKFFVEKGSFSFNCVEDKKDLHGWTQGTWEVVELSAVKKLVDALTKIYQHGVHEYGEKIGGITEYAAIADEALKEWEGV